MILERRRLRGWQLYQRGWSMRDIAKALGVSVNAVWKWVAVGQANGDQALKARPTPGRPARLSARHRLMLIAMLRDDPSAYGLRSDVWTIADTQAMIKRLFDVEYTPQHVGRLLRQATTSNNLLPPMLRIELDDLLAQNNIMVVRRRIRASKSTVRTSASSARKRS